MTSRWIALEQPDTQPADAPGPPTVNSHAIRIAIALLVIIGIGTAVLSLPAASRIPDGAAPLDALFTAVSAATITGMVVVPTGDHWTFWGQLAILVLIQIGGLGFAVGASLLLQIMRRRQSLRDQLLMRDGSPVLSLQEAIGVIRRVILYTFAIELAGAVLLAVRFAADMPIPQAVWFGLFHSISAFCNGGFDLMPGFSSIAGYRESVWINVVLIVLVQAGSLGYFAVRDVAVHRRWQPLPLDAKLVLSTNALLLAAGAILFLLAEWDRSMSGFDPGDRLLAALFQSVMARSGGFATIDWSQADPVTVFGWLGLMFVGGAAGSTAGGVKLATIGVLLAASVAAVSGAREPQIFRRRLPLRLVWQALATVFISAAIFSAAAVLLTVVEDGFGQSDKPFILLSFETMSALGTVGLSTGQTPLLTDAGKLVLCLTMILGRLGPLTLAYALQRRRTPPRFRYPEEPVRIG